MLGMLVVRVINLWEVRMSRKFLILLVGIFMIGSVLALGISPARTTLDFEPELEREIAFDIVNSEGKDIDLTLSAQGDLGKYIRISTPRVSLLSSEESKSLSYSIDLPEELSPGLHTGKVLVTEVPEDADSSGSYVRATLAVAIQLHVYVPYPGKYADADLYVYSGDVGEDVRFVIPVVSVGKFDLASVRANVDVYNKLNEKIDSFNTKSIGVSSGEKRELVYDWKAEVPVGEYLAKVTVIYDDGTLSLEEVFSVGSKELELQEIRVGDFSLGEIAKLEMLVENKWSETISGAHIETKIRDAEGDVVSSFESAAQDIAALSKEVFVSYWDTAGVREGDYDAEVSISYGDKESKRNLKFEVSENDLVIVGLGYVISAEGEAGTDSVVVVLIVVIVVLVLINLLWFLLLRKKLKS